MIPQGWQSHRGGTAHQRKEGTTGSHVPQGQIPGHSEQKKQVPEQGVIFRKWKANNSMCKVHITRLVVRVADSELGG